MITDELRDCIRCANRTYEDARNPYNDREILHIAEEVLLAIADRIDERNARDVFEADVSGYSRALEEVNESYIKLPVDADGVPICVGDTIEIEHNGRVTQVDCITCWEESWMVCCSEGGMFDPKKTRCHHVQPDTWEHIIEDAAKLARGDNDAVMELVERCRRLAGDA